MRSGQYTGHSSTRSGRCLSCPSRPGNGIQRGSGVRKCEKTADFCTYFSAGSYVRAGTFGRGRAAAHGHACAGSPVGAYPSPTPKKFVSWGGRPHAHLRKRIFPHEAHERRSTCQSNSSTGLEDGSTPGAAPHRAGVPFLPIQAGNRRGGTDRHGQRRQDGPGGPGEAVRRSSQPAMRHRSGPRRPRPCPPMGGGARWLRWAAPARDSGPRMAARRAQFHMGQGCPSCPSRLGTDAAALIGTVSATRTAHRHRTRHPLTVQRNGGHKGGRGILACGQHTLVNFLTIRF